MTPKLDKPLPKFFSEKEVTTLIESPSSDNEFGLRDRAIMEVLYEGFGNPKYAPCPLLVNMVMAGKKGIKTGEGFYSWTHGTKELVVADNFKK